METVDLRKEYFFEGNDIGCLVIHGFTSTPAELRELGERIHKLLGYTVLGVRLKGHGTTMEDMEQCKYTHWIESAEEGYERLRKCCSKVFVVGHSMGGLLALHVAAHKEVDKVITLAPAIANNDKVSSLVPILKHFIKYTGWGDGYRPEEEMKYLLGYNKFPLSAVHELNKLQKAVRKDLKYVSKPILFIQSKKDQSVHPKGINIIEKNVSTKDITKIYLQNCRHNLTVECEKEKVYEEVIKYIKQ